MGSRRAERMRPSSDGADWVPAVWRLEEGDFLLLMGMMEAVGYCDTWGTVLPEQSGAGFLRRRSEGCGRVNRDAGRLGFVVGEVGCREVK